VGFSVGSGTFGRLQVRFLTVVFDGGGGDWKDVVGSCVF